MNNTHSPLNSASAQAVILLIEDDPANLSVLTEFLTAHDFTVRVARDGKTGIRLAHQASPDLILLDVMLPDINGFDVCQQLKADEQTQSIPVLFTTVSADIANKVRGFAVGAVDYITKPFQLDEVLARVRTHLELRHLQVQLEQAYTEVEDRVQQRTAELKQAEQRQLQLALEKERGETFRILMSNIAHDLKMPLAIINTSLYLLEKHSDFAKRQEKVDTIKRQVRILDSFIQDLLDMARLDSEPQFKLIPVDVNELVMGLEADHHDIITQKRLTFSLDLEETLLPIQADQTDLRRALANLVENAIQYTPEKGSVTVRTYRQAKDVALEIIDTGIGISGDALPHIFDRFYRSAEAQALANSGAGLGLAITKRVVEMHGGAVEVNSTLGEGTTFRVLLPS